MENATQPNPKNQAVAAGADNDLTGKTLGDFRIMRRLGQGGMGQVYLAEQLSLKRKVALKILRPDLAADATALKRFKAEAEAVARITHANIVQVYAIGESGGQHYMALEFVDGRNLREYLLRKGPPEILLALSIIRQVAAALQRASELGIVHRDIKPENILLNRKGEVKVADFGLSRCFAGDQPALNITQSGVTMGTPLYMSPEQVQGKEIDPRTDIYSLGVTCYHMLSGEPPYRGSTAFEVAMMHVQNQPVPLQDIRPDLPADLAAIVHKMMAKNPTDRYQTGRELLKDLTRVRETLGVGERTQGVSLSSIQSGPNAAAGSANQLPLNSTTLLPRRRWWRAAAVLTVLLALVGGAAFRVVQKRLQKPAGADPAGNAATVRDPDEALERDLREKAARPFDESRLKEAFDDQAALGLFYLQKRRLGQADELFAGLVKNPPGQHDVFRILGQLGQAMVLAFQDSPAESNKLFLEALRNWRSDRKKGDKDSALLAANSKLWETIDEALNHNARNAELPPVLEALRWQPGKRPGPFKGMMGKKGT